MQKKIIAALLLLAPSIAFAAQAEQWEVQQGPVTRYKDEVSGCIVYFQKQKNWYLISSCMHNHYVATKYKVSEFIDTLSKPETIFHQLEVQHHLHKQKSTKAKKR